MHRTRTLRDAKNSFTGLNTSERSHYWNPPPPERVREAAILAELGRNIWTGEELTEEDLEEKPVEWLWGVAGDAVPLVVQLLQRKMMGCSKRLRSAV